MENAEAQQIEYYVVVHTNYNYLMAFKSVFGLFDYHFYAGSTDRYNSKQERD